MKHAQFHTLVHILILALFLGIGLGIRMYDLTDQPIDFHPTRQLRSMVVARGMFYKALPEAEPDLTEKAIGFSNTVGQYEPPILEQVIAWLYRLTGAENFWYARIVNSLLWLLGGLALYDLARRMLQRSGDSSPGISPAGLLALAYYLILPFSVQASRSFQPDPGMVVWIILTAYLLFRWSRAPLWKWAILAGLIGGLAILTKFVAAYIVGGAAVGIVFSTLGWRKFWRNPQVWVMLLLMVLPSALYYMTRQGRAADYIETWTISLSHLLLEPSFYARWLSLVQNLVEYFALLLGLIGVLVSTPRNRVLLAGLWVGYLVYGLTLPYQMYTHSYYHLQLIPIVALSLAPVFQLLVERLRGESRIWRFLAIAVATVAVGYWGSLSIIEQNKEDFRGETAYWQEIASYLPSDGKIMGLTQDYGYRLMYYGWRKVTAWPPIGERQLAELRGSGKEFGDLFQNRIEGKSYFLITAFGQYNDQPDLKQHLEANYPLVAQGDGYLIFDLR